ncbi:hypothetical protein ABVK25_010412 [Lepraria finkii]|uniref:Ankyrin n=1 Tax=Lepraria finkii TaxID=1340010 RepID=A0ABR4AUZ4_9LECA
MFDLAADLKAACTTGDMPLAKSHHIHLVSAGPLIKTPALSKMATVVAKNAHPAILSFCFSEGLVIDPEHVNDPLIYAACDSGSIPIFRVLLDNGVEVNNYLELGGDPLVSACYHGNVELATFLLDQGAGPNSNHALGCYISLIWPNVGDKASLDLPRLLLERGAVVKREGALIAAAEHGNLGAIELLLGNGDVDLEEVVEYRDYDSRKLNDQRTALYKAATNGDGDTVDFFPKKGADAGFRDRKGRSVADMAEERGHRDTARKLR